MHFSRWISFCRHRQNQGFSLISASNLTWRSDCGGGARFSRGGRGKTEKARQNNVELKGKTLLCKRANRRACNKKNQQKFVETRPSMHIATSALWIALEMRKLHYSILFFRGNSPIMTPFLTPFQKMLVFLVYPQKSWNSIGTTKRVFKTPFSSVKCYCHS